jgi:uncharacterized RDD family membrane protein YckC
MAAGFWRRIGAFIVDTAILGLVGFGLGLFFSEQFIEMGAWGHAVGFVVAMAYFTILNSGLADGQTPGKRLLRVQVVDRAGRPLSVGKSWLRFLPLGVAYFLNNIPASQEVLVSAWGQVLSVAVFGLGLSMLYLYLFNRRTRQSLHDLLVGSYVVPVGATTVPQLPPWRGHYVVVGALLVTAAVGPSFTREMSEKDPWGALLAIQQAVESEPLVWHSDVGLATTRFTRDGNTTVTTHLDVVARLTRNEIEREEHAARIAAKVMELYEPADSLDLIVVKLSYGYDIGIARMWTDNTHAHPPAQWRAKMGASGGGT